MNSHSILVMRFNISSANNNKICITVSMYVCVLLLVYIWTENTYTYKCHAFGVMFRQKDRNCKYMKFGYFVRVETSIDVDFGIKQKQIRSKYLLQLQIPENLMAITENWTNKRFFMILCLDCLLMLAGLTFRRHSREPTWRNGKVSTLLKLNIGCEIWRKPILIRIFHPLSRYKSFGVYPFFTFDSQVIRYKWVQYHIFALWCANEEKWLKKIRSLN